MISLKKILGKFMGLLAAGCFIGMGFSFIIGFLAALVGIFFPDPFIVIKDTAVLVFIVSFIVGAIAFQCSGIGGGTNWEHLETSQP